MPVYLLTTDDHMKRRTYIVGKAKNLRSRLSNYFQDVANLHPRTRRMVTTASSVEWTVVTSEVLAATGRKAHTADLGLEACGVRQNADGAIMVDGNYRTNVPSIYAIGDAAAGDGWMPR